MQLDLKDCILEIAVVPRVSTLAMLGSVQEERPSWIIEIYTPVYVVGIPGSQARCIDCVFISEHTCTRNKDVNSKDRIAINIAPRITPCLYGSCTSTTPIKDYKRIPLLTVWRSTRTKASVKVLRLLYTEISRMSMQYALYAFNSYIPNIWPSL